MNILSNLASMRPARLPTTKAQQRLLKIYHLGERFKTIHNIGGLFRIDGDVDPAILRAAIQEVMKSHAILRGTFSKGDDGIYFNITDATACVVPFDLHAIASDETGLLVATFNEILKLPFDIYREVPWRMHYLRTAAGKSAVVLAMHHLISDYQSVAIIIKEMIYFYEKLSGRSPSLYEAAYTSDEDALLHYAEQEEAACKRYLKDVRDRISGVKSLKLFEKDVELFRRSFDLNYSIFRIDDRLTQDVVELAHKFRISVSSIYITALSLLLHECSGQDEFLIGFPVDGRSEGKNIRAVGFLSAPSVLKMNIDPHDTIVNACIQNMREIRRAFRARFVPISDAFQTENGEQGAGIQALFSFVSVPYENDGTNTISIERIIAGIARSDLDIWLTIVNKNNQLHGVIELSLDISDRCRLEQLADRYVSLLRAIIADPTANVGSIVSKYQFRSKDTIDIAASFTADPIASAAAFWCGKSGLQVSVILRPYQMVMQSLLEEPSGEGASRGFFCLLRIGDFFRNRVDQPSEAEYDALIADLCNAFSSSLARRRVVHVAIVCPTAELAIEAKLAEDRLVRSLTAVSGLKCINLSDFFYAGQFSPDKDRLAHIPYHDDFYEYLAIEIAREAYLASTPKTKVVVLDCDNTLWRGVIGEDGVDGVSLDEGHLALHRRVVQLHDAGVLIALCSKNDHEVVETFFRQRSDTLLKWHHIAATRISWNSKFEGIASLAQELNLGLDSFLFIDDNPLEIIDVQHRLPEVLCIRVPDDPAKLEPFIANLWTLAVEPTSSEDARRTSMYQTEAKRKALSEKALSYSDFVASLNVKVDFRPLCADNLARACQISQRTNQFNLLSTRYTESDLLTIADKPDYVARIVSCEDRFGSYGEIGLVVARCLDTDMQVESLALSCRAMGRGVEIEMVRELGRIGVSRRLETLSLTARKTARNTPGMNFVRSLGGLGEGEFTDDMSQVTVPILAASKIDDATILQQPGPSSQANEFRNTQLNRSHDAERLQWIASHLALRHHSEPRSNNTYTVDKGFEPETIVRGIWTSLLKRPPKDQDEPFSTAGLDSLGAVNFVLQIQEASGLAVSLDAFYAARTFGGICALLRQKGSTKTHSHELQAQIFEDMELPFSDVPLVTSPPPRVTISQAKHILLTGATGFVGTHLLVEVLKCSNARVVCLVRDTSAATGLDRIRSALNELRLFLSDATMSRIDVLIGDLTKQDLGLGDQAFDELATRIDLLIHCGAEVNFFRPYHTLRHSNVLGTRTLLRFAATKKIKPFHYISTMGVFHSPNMHGSGDLPESASQEIVSALPTGYQQSKFVSECLLARGRERGMPVTVIRLGTIAGSLKTGRINSRDFFVSLIGTIHEMGVMPEMRDLDFLPADFTGQAIVAIADDTTAIGNTFNLAHPNSLPIPEIQRWYELAGHKMDIVPLRAWIVSVNSFLTDHPKHHFSVFRPLIESKHSAKSLFEILVSAPKIVTQNAEAVLERANLKYPALDRHLLARYLDRYQEIGWLLRPEKRLHYQDRFLMSFPEHMRGYCIWGDPPRRDADYVSAAAIGEANSSHLNLRLVSHIESIASVYKEKKIYVTGTVECPVIHAAPLTIQAGHWELKPQDGYRIDDANSLIFLRYRLELRDAEGQCYTALGYKVSENFGSIFFESQTLNLRIFRNGEDEKKQVVGRVTLPFAEFVQDQIDSMNFRADVDAKAANRYKILWMAFIAKELLSNYLSLAVKNDSVSFVDIRAFLNLLGMERVLNNILGNIRSVSQMSGYLSNWLKLNSRGGN